jgi:hypothetical protein
MEDIDLALRSGAGDAHAVAAVDGGRVQAHLLALLFIVVRDLQSKAVDLPFIAEYRK